MTPTKDVRDANVFQWVLEEFHGSSKHPVNLWNEEVPGEPDVMVQSIFSLCGSQGVLGLARLSGS